MDVVVIFNGLGNQMSQYAFYLQKKAINKSTRYINTCKTHNGLELSKVFNITLTETFSEKFLYILYRILSIRKIKIISNPLKFLLGVLKCKIVSENFNYNFNERFLSSSSGITFYSGGWHSESYFSSIKDQILSKFEFVKPIDAENNKHISNILINNSVSIHVRRGDYLSPENLNLFGDVCSKEYFDAAINLVKTKVSDPHFFVFSNDMEWVKSNLNLKQVTYVTCNTKENSWKDMYLMTLCKHNIISNSTFSWWGAWLNKTPGKIVISPSRFLSNDTVSDIYPKSWIKLSDY